MFYTLSTGTLAIHFIFYLILLFFSDALVDSMLLMNSPWPVAILVACYLYFVTKFGPQYMANRKPYKLKEIMILYNFGQVVANAWFLYWVRIQ